MVVAIALVSLLVLALSNLDMFSRFHVMSADRQAAIQYEASLALDHMFKHVSMAIGALGDPLNPVIVEYADKRGFRVKIDTNGNGVRDDDSQDLWIAYRYETMSPASAFVNELRYYPNAGTGASPAGGYESIAKGLINSDFSQLPSSGAWGFAYFLNPNVHDIEVWIRCRWNPALPRSMENPEVEMHERIYMPSVSSN